MYHTEDLKIHCMVDEKSSALLFLSVDSILFDEGATLQRNNTTELQIVEVAREYIHANFCDKLRVENIAREVFMSQYHFSRIFKKHTRYSPYQYLLEIRLRHARRLMYQTGLTIKEITYRSGFNSIDYFSAAFSKKYSMCPSMYRRSLHKN